MTLRGAAVWRGVDNLLDPARRRGLEATEHFMSWLRFGISAFAAGAYLISLQQLRPVDARWAILVGAAFLYSIPNILIVPGQPTRWTRLRVLVNTILDFGLVTAAVFMTGGDRSPFTWLYPLTIVGNVLRYGDMAGALTAGGSMLAFGTIIVWNGSSPAAVVPVLIAHLGSFWVLYLMAAYLSRYAMRMERVARQGAQLMEAIGRIGVPVNLVGSVSLALGSVCEEIRILFDVDHVFIWLVEGQELVGAAATGPGKEEFLSMRCRLDAPDLFAAQVVRDRRPMFVNNAGHNTGGLDADLVRAFGIEAMAGIPLIHGNAAAGAMMLVDTKRPLRFREEDLAPAMLLGNLAATALYHASMHDQLRKAYTRTLETLGEAIDVRDAYTGGHSQRIARYAAEIGQAMGCSEEMLSYIQSAALLHDIGKIGIPDSILLKPGRLTEREVALMKSHSLIGARLLRTAGFPEDVVAFVRHLHERYDGWGYPAGLQGDAIPLGSRILAVADTYEAMTSDRIYRRALTPETALAELVRFSGSQYDPQVVDAFLNIAESLPRGEPATDQAAGVADPAGAFSELATSLLDRFRQFAGDQVITNIRGRLAAEAQRSGWELRFDNGTLDVQMPDRLAALEARRQILAWLLMGIEHAGGRRITMHLLAEAVDELPAEAREAYRVLLAPADLEDTTVPSGTEFVRTTLQ